MVRVPFEIVFDRLKIDLKKLKLTFVFDKEKSLLVKSSHSTIIFFKKIRNDYLFKIRF